MGDQKQQQTSIIRYGSLDDAEMAAISAEVAKGSTSRWKPPVGETALRVIPPRPGEKVMLVVYQHFAKIAGLRKAVFCNCPRLMSTGPCPLCREFERLAGSRNRQDRDLAYEVYRPKASAMMNILVRGTADVPDHQERWSFGKARVDELTTLRRSRGGGDWTNPTEKGFDLLLNRKGTGRDDTEYTLLMDPQRRPLVANEDGVFDEERAMQIICDQPDLRIYLVTPSAEEIEAMMRGEEVRRSVGNDGGRRPHTPPGRTVGDSVESQRGGSTQPGGPSESDIPF